jgi:predicted phosphate transport protein (TIGR00153 family)
MFFRKEKEVVELILKFIETVENCITTAEQTIRTYLGDDLQNAKALARKTRNLESEADLIRHEIRDKLYLGAYLPLLREDIYKLVESIDKVCNAGEACCDFFLNQRPEFPENLKPLFKDIGSQSMGIITSLKLAVLCYFKGECKIEVVRDHTREVGMLESDVDKKEWDLTKAIFTSPDLEFSHKRHLRDCLDTIVEVSDRAEDAADQLELATLKSMA